MLNEKFRVVFFESINDLIDSDELIRFIILREVFFILNEKLQPVCQGEIGELFIAGPGWTVKGIIPGEKNNE